MTENKRLENLTDLANLLRTIVNVPDAEMGFDMLYDYSDADETIHECGSACCIGGWVQYLNPETRDGTLTDAVLSICPEGITGYEVSALCYPGIMEPFYASPSQAARAVEILRDTGKCDWLRAMEEGV